MGIDENLEDFDVGVDRRTWIVLAGILLFAALLRCWQINESLWLDELHTSWVVTDGLAEIPARAAMGNQSSLYFYLPWLSIRLFGETEFALRLPSLLAGLALVVLVFTTTKLWTNSDAAGLFAAALVAIDRTSVFYATEARAYAWVQAIGVAHVLVFDEWLRRPTAWKRLAIVALGAALFHLHYTAALLFFAEAACWLISRKFCKPTFRYSIQSALIDLIGLAAIVAAIPHLLDIAERRDNWRQFVSVPDWSALLTLMPLDVYVAIPLVILALDYAARRLWPRKATGVSAANETSATASLVGRKAPFLLSAAWFAVPLAIAWLLTRANVASLFFARYLLVGLPALFIVSGLCLARTSKVVTRTLLVGATLFASIVSCRMLDQWQFDGRLLNDRREDWRSAVRYINDSPDCLDCPVFVYAGLIEAVQYRQAGKPRAEEYATLPLRGVYRVTNGNSRVHSLLVGVHTVLLRNFKIPDDPYEMGGTFWIRIGPEGSEALLSRKEFWVITRLPGRKSQQWEADAISRIETWITHSPIDLVDRQEFGGVTVSRWRYR